MAYTYLPIRENTENNVLLSSIVKAGYEMVFTDIISADGTRRKVVINGPAIPLSNDAEIMLRVGNNVTTPYSIKASVWQVDFDIVDQDLKDHYQPKLY
jgi:hypothetical protein